MCNYNDYVQVGTNMSRMKSNWSQIIASPDVCGSEQMTFFAAHHQEAKRMFCSLYFNWLVYSKQSTNTNDSPCFLSYRV